MNGRSNLVRDKDRMITEEIAASLARFFDGGRGPTHDELGRLFRRSGLAQADPLTKGQCEPIGKMKRAREVLSYALDHDVNAGDELVRLMIGTIKAAGGFRETSDAYAGDDIISAARTAFEAAGYDLDPDGNLRPALLENLEGSLATEALRNYIRRAQRGADDAALVVGTGKDLVEATARHVLVEATGSYPPSTNFAATLHLAFDRLGLASCYQLLGQLDHDPQAAIQQSLYLLANAVNRLRNAEGTGHGRPFVPGVSDQQGRLAIQAMGIVSQLLLDAKPAASADGATPVASGMVSH